MTELRRFTNEGVRVFQEFLAALRSGEEPSYPDSALTDPALSQLVSRDVSLERRPFASRMELAQYLHDSFQSAAFRPGFDDRGMWAWLGCFFFEAVCPQKRGRADPGADARWVPESLDWRRYYRHLIAGPYRILLAHIDEPARAMALLCQRPGRPGDLVEQLASRQQIVTSPAIMATATALYVDTLTGKQRPLANSKGPGSARRFVNVLDQFDVTWDLAVLPGPALQQMLPNEFPRAT